jgi:thioredoxin-like negative regulator of GroEL
LTGSALADGLDEARRGLWLSAVESLTTALHDDPTDPRAPLALAVTRLLRGQPEQALVVLETAPSLREAQAPWRDRAAWLVAAARLDAGDPQGALRAAQGLPGAARHRVEAAVRLQGGDYAAGVRALLIDRIPVRILRPLSSPGP